MKVSVLVAAAMVITSVNADRYEGFLDCLGRICRSRSKLSQDSPKQGLSQRLQYKKIKKDPVCGPVVKELSLSRSKINEFNYKFENQVPDFHQLMMGGDDDEEGTNHDLNLKKMQELLKSNPEAIPRLRELQTESIELKEEHLSIWKYLLGIDCPTEGLDHLSPEGMIQQGHFIDWYDNNGMDIFGEQQNHI
ncbi:hypothetical protein BASA62_006703 [Batrachochytrium salamandrivorans]|nr:hypothetical protein BASA62_006703 [Batrachochytrium salamandrivorans]